MGGQDVVDEVNGFCGQFLGGQECVHAILTCCGGFFNGCEDWSGVHLIILGSMLKDLSAKWLSTALSARREEGRMAIEHCNGDCISHHSVLHFDESGVRLFIDAREPTKWNELAQGIVRCADAFSEHVLQLTGVFSVTPCLNGRGTTGLSFTFLSDRADFEIEMRKGATADLGVKVFRPFKRESVAESLEKLLSIGVSRMKFEDATTFFVFECLASMLANPDIVLLKTRHVFGGFVPIRRMSGFDLEGDDALATSVVSFAMEVFDEIFPSIREFFHRFNCLCAISRADVKCGKALSASAKQWKKLPHGRPNVKLGRFGQFLKLDTPHAFTTKGSRLDGIIWVDCFVVG